MMNSRGEQSADLPGGSDLPLSGQVGHLRRSGRFRETIAPIASLHTRVSRLWLCGAYVLFVISLGLPVQQGWNWGLGRGGSQLVTTYGIQCLVFGLAGNAGFLAGLFSGRTASPFIVSWGLWSSILGILQGLAWLVIFRTFGAVLREGFYVWFGSILTLTIWFAQFRSRTESA